MAIFKSDKNTSFNPQEINILNAGTTLSGNLSSEGDIRIDGQVKGNVTVKAKLVLGPSSRVEGNVVATNCDVSGTVLGNVQVAEILAIKSSASITGDLQCAKLIIEAGASFNGRSKMGPAQENFKDHGKTGAETKQAEDPSPAKG
ncbi:MAG: polymer-forming cytoskeletal protein [Bacteroidetes bacterium]|nr:polymer-forming cytoskeletal protein [Bacteroidota bacterium]